MALIKEKTKKHKGENAIGKIIYGFLLFAPLLAILVTCMYVTFNKNAYESYSGKTEEITNVNINYKYETNAVNSTDDLIIGNIYHYYQNLNSVVDYNFQVEDIYFISSTYQVYNYNTSYNSTDNSGFFLTVKDNLFKLYTLPNQYLITSREYVEEDIEFYFVLKQKNTLTIDYISQSDYLPIENVNITTEEVSELDNVFYDATEKVEESNLFNWAKQTGTYTVLHTTTTGIGITNTFVPMLMAYWLLISVIYFIFDIALILIWMVHDKIHELKDSI